jgi:hypothetical protein
MSRMQMQISFLKGVKESQIQRGRTWVLGAITVTLLNHFLLVIIHPQ